MPRVTRACVLAMAACGSTPHPAPPPPPAAPPAFDARRVAADLERALEGIDEVVAANRRDCPRLARELRSKVEFVRPWIVEAQQAKDDPDHARMLTQELHAYDKVAAGRAERIGDTLVSCLRAHPELKEDLRAAIDAIPTL